MKKKKENKNQKVNCVFQRRWKNTILCDKNVRGNYCVIDCSLNENVKGNFTYKKNSNAW